MRNRVSFRILSAFVLFALSFSSSPPAQVEAEMTGFSQLRDFDFESATQGWVLLDNHLFRTTDGGRNWSDISPAESIGAVTFAGQEGWVVLNSGPAYSLAHTLTAGKNWQDWQIQLFSAQDAWILPKSIHVEFSDSNNGIIRVQHATSANFNIQSSFETHDGGLTWVQTDFAVNLPPEKNISDKSAVTLRRDMLTASTGWSLATSGDCSFSDPLNKAGADCTQESRLQRTADGGRTWQTIPLPQTTGGILQKRVTQMDAGIAQSQQAFTQTWVGQGVDICEIPSLGKLQTWWNNSPYTAVNLYIGGAMRACDNVNLSKTFLLQLNQQGWKFIPTWVGPQAACTGYSVRMSSDPFTAYQQGMSEAGLALTTAAQLGLTGADKTGTVIYYDLEAYNTSNSACKDAASMFIQGWTDRMEAAGNVSAMYGASCASALTDIANLSNPPDAIWVANWYLNYAYNSAATVWNTACLANSYWPNHQRIRQYTGGHNETWGGVTLNVDSNVLDGVVAVPAQGLVSDAFANASVISYTPYMDAQSIGAATTAAGDPSLPCISGQGYNSVWYSFTPAVSESVLVSTTGSTYDTVLAVWTGSPGSFVNQGCNDNFSGTLSQVQFDAGAGTTYFIEAASPSAAVSGTLILSVFQPAQDDFNGAKTLSRPSAVTVNTASAGVSNDDPAAPACGLAPGSNSVWYKFTPSTSGLVSLDSFSSTYDTYLAVWSGSRGALSLVACNDDNSGGQQSHLEVSLAGGTTYFVEAAQFNGTVSAAQVSGGGTLQLHLTSFNDVPGTYWAWSWIERLFASGVTGGCGSPPMQYCPESNVTRAQMAVFLLKGIHGAGYAPPALAGSTGFADVALDHWAAAWIKQLAAEGITGGCGGGNYCPESNVTRAQMAVFLLKSKHGSTYTPPPASGVFSDVPPGYWARAWIEQLAAEGITAGCGTGIYCPESSVTRAQMAVFLVKTFGLP